jgi:hypothetical protein
MTDASPNSPTAPNTAAPKVPGPTKGRITRILAGVFTVLILGAGLTVLALNRWPDLGRAISPVAGPNDRIAALEADVAALKSFIAALTQRTEGLGPLEERIAALEAKLAQETSADAADNAETTTAPTSPAAAMPAGLDLRLNTIEHELARVPNLERDLARLSNLETALQNQPRLEKAEAVRRAATTALVLARAIDSGAPFAIELDLARHALSAGPWAQGLEALAGDAERGIARREDNRARFDAMIAALEAEGEPIDPELSAPMRWLERLRRLVIIRPLSPEAGPSVAAVISRARAAMVDGRAEQAANELAPLVEAAKSPARQAAQTWCRDVARRAAADRVLAALSAEIAAGISEAK